MTGPWAAATSIADIHLFRLYWRFRSSLSPAPGEFPNIEATTPRMMARAGGEQDHRGRNRRSATSCRRKQRGRLLPPALSGPLLPVELRRTVVEWFGEEGRSWCDALPVTVGSSDGAMEAVTPGKPLAGATHALVLDCLRSDGSPAVLKLPFVDDENPRRS